MQISDLLGQYSRNVANGTEELKGAQSVQKLVSTLEELAAGSIFEGTVSSIKNGKAVLALGNGQTILARLEGKMDVRQGVSMFFQVKSNDGVTVAIRPYHGMGNIKNPILLNALTTAGVPVNDKSMAMVEAMMNEQMPVGKGSLLDMARLLSANPGVEPDTIVKMVKLGIPVNPEMAAQFENYAMDRQAVLKEMDSAINQIADALGGGPQALENQEESVLLYEKIMDVLQEKGEAYKNNSPVESMLLKDVDASKIVPAAFGQIGGETEAAAQTAGTGWAEEAAQETGAEQTAEPEKAVQETEAGIQQAENGRSPAGMQTLGQIFSEEQLTHLTHLLEGVPVLAGDERLFPAAEGEFYINTLEEDFAEQEEEKNVENSVADSTLIEKKNVLDKEMPVQDFLREIRNILEENSQYGFRGVKKLFSSREFKTAVKQAFEEQWTIRPEELKQENKISQLYEKLNRQMTQMEQAMKAAGAASEAFTQTVNDIRGNIEFMNQINQIYAYVQMPLQMTGQKANGELYVYTNKKLLHDRDAELSAFLHLDLENLGSTDVSIKMQQKNVQTKFYLADDAAYQLVEKHIPLLEKRLKNKGYHCTVTLSGEEKKVDFVEDFLTREKPSAGMVHRYSFDVKA